MIGSTGSITAIGAFALSNAHLSNANNEYNMGIGAYAGGFKTNSSNNVCVGYASGQNIEQGNRNIMIGNNTNQNTTNSAYNTNDSIAIGYHSRSIHNNSICIGSETISTKANQIILGNNNITELNTSGTIICPSLTCSTSSLNTLDNTINNNGFIIGQKDSASVFLGVNAGNKTMTGTGNICCGQNTGWQITSGSSNVGIGDGALYNITTGIRNTSIGDLCGAGNSGSYNVFVGAQAASGSSSANYSTVVGYQARCDNFTNCVCIGNNAIATSSNQIVLGDTNITELKTSGKVICNGVQVNDTSDENSIVMANGTVNTTMKADVSTLQTSMTTANTNITDLQTDVNILKSPFLPYELFKFVNRGLCWYGSTAPVASYTNSASTHYTITGTVSGKLPTAGINSITNLITLTPTSIANGVGVSIVNTATGPCCMIGGGFLFTCSFNFLADTIALGSPPYDYFSQQFFCGLTTQTTALTLNATTLVSSKTNIIGVYNDISTLSALLTVNNPNLKFIGGSTSVDLGSYFPHDNKFDTTFYCGFNFFSDYPLFN